ncbi:serine hydrolase domain-containing protein [Pseudonocardia parietis]|uniref:D-alanyl-D-alanine carboxypeptidase n=1 Tax=Pseudonocardia parietis TaxID=570936 RepID=A0ABS4VX83_9PSEU|nr:serine hydrolase domain-containing protein [Pseudonocardia parietis]MBP2368526.1 D-alanyl-D-alanine carboxypeptidase [Pseudonocardia parietis]
MSTPPRSRRPQRALSALAAAGVLLATAACGGQASATVGEVPAYGAALQPELEQQVSEMLVTGAAVDVRSPELGDWTTTIGTRAYRGTDPVQIADHVRIGSVTKTWTGTVVLQLVDEGRIRLDDPVATYRPDVPNGRNITIRQMLSMRSGLGNYTTSPDLSQRMDADPGAVFDPEELIRIGLAQPVEFPPGQGFFYSNTNTVLLGRIVEQITGSSLETEIERRVLTPLGMTGSSFPTTSGALPEPHPQGYTYGTNVETIDTNVLSPEKQAAARAGTLAPIDVTLANPSWAWSAGAGISTADDLTAYVRALAGEGLLSPAMQQTRLDSVQPTDPADPASAAYGLALARFGPYYGHTGELPGFNTFVGYDPQSGTSIVVWASLAPSPDGRPPAVEMAKTIIAELAGAG